MRLIVEICTITICIIYLCPEDTNIREQRENNNQLTNRLGTTRISIYPGLARHTGSKRWSYLTFTKPKYANAFWRDFFGPVFKYALMERSVYIIKEGHVGIASPGLICSK